MPQDIPMEASEDLAYTPPALAEHDPKPVFVLRSATMRDKRFQSRIYRENGFAYHGKEATRAEVMAALNSGDLWTKEQADEYCPLIKALWEAQDDFEQQSKEEPELVWTYDAEIERSVGEVIEKVAKAWAPLRRMAADNAEMGQILVPATLAIMVKSWTGFECPRQLDSGYLTLECAEVLTDRLGKISQIALSELFVAAIGRMRLEDEEQKNSESPSPSKTAPKPLTEKKASASAGASPAPATSTKTPEIA